MRHFITSVLVHAALLCASPPERCRGAVITLGPIVSDVRGKVAGVVFSKARGGVHTARTLVRPSNPNTTAQTLIRAALSNLSAVWRNTLSQVQRNAWDAIAPSGETGQGTFVGNNSLVIQSGGAYIAAAPTSPTLADAPVQTAITADASSHSVDINAAPASDTLVLIYVSRPQSQSRSARQFSYLYAGSLGAGDGTSLVLPTTHPAYGMAANQVVYVKTRAIDPTTGQIAAEQEFRVVVQA